MNNNNSSNLSNNQVRDLVKCEICGQEMQSLASHLFRKHNINTETYRQLYPGAKTLSDYLTREQSERVKGDKNPAYQHGGKFSPFSKNFVKGTENIEATKKRAAKTRLENGNNSTNIEYWLKKTDGDVEEAQKLLSERQTTFSLEKCIQKHGEEKGRRVWLDRQEKWHKNFKKSNFSKISQELFWSIADKLDSLEHIYFAQLDENKIKNDTGKNHELKLKLERVILPDFINTNTKKIIEFDGVYWHGKIGHGNKKRIENRDEILIDNGYTILHINEDDYKNNKQGTVDRCLNFLME